MRIRHLLRLIAMALVPALLAIGFQSPADAAAAHKAPLAAKKTYKLLWSQEFNSTKTVGPSSKVFTYDIGDGSTGPGPGWGNNELEYYTDKNARTDKHGNMVITATRIPTADGPTEQYPYFCGSQPTEVCPWISSRFHTAGKIGFQYGKIEARMQMPVGDGTWPAFWLLGANVNTKGWPDSGEIDIMEGSGADPFLARGSAHGPGYSGAEARTNIKYSRTSLQTSFHTYAIEWTKDVIVWYLDGKAYFTLKAKDVKPNKWPMNQEFFLILNLAVGGWFVGNVVDPTLQSAQFKIDYIRYYSINGVGKLIKH
jgi:beta-glucanase (GH16 family)